LPIHLIHAIEKWHQQVGPIIPEWLRAVGEFEALGALAGYAYEHPNDPFPEIVNDRLLFDAKGVGHPLLPIAACIRNDVRFDDQLQLIMISGSNMSGKSTLLR
jgi:DNA mismatch repair ATPase MutS